MNDFTFPLSCRLWQTGDDASANAELHFDDTLLHFTFLVEEKELRRMVYEDQGPVWTDSCVEIFISPDGSLYWNFEFSATGAMYAAFGKGREGRTLLKEDFLSSVKRTVTIFENNNHRSRWKLEGEIDLKKAGICKRCEELEELYLNLYKCGDLLRRPHYLSAFDIDLPVPDFHCPQFFQRIRILKKAGS